MKFSILTLFPDVINAYLNSSIIAKAIQSNKIMIQVVDIRDFTDLKHHQVDDYQYGGGKGMVLMPEPVVKAIESVRTENSLVILTTPQGKVFNQTVAKELRVLDKDLVLVCGHYEGFDERILKYVDLELSIGDYVLTGGELAALAVMDAIARILPNVIQQESYENESFENGLLDYPVYTKPYNFRDDLVPEVLLSGHHENIRKYREEQSLLNTLKKRPDLIDEAKLTAHQLTILKKYKLSKGE
jgi:tRNA (guanine37-N1)-methyltransferase